MDSPGADPEGEGGGGGGGRLSSSSSPGAARKMGEDKENRRPGAQNGMVNGEKRAEPDGEETGWAGMLSRAMDLIREKDFDGAIVDLRKIINVSGDAAVSLVCRKDVNDRFRALSLSLSLPVRQCSHGAAQQGQDETRVCPLPDGEGGRSRQGQRQLLK